MSAQPWMPLYVADYLADTAHLTTAEHGAYLLLIMHYWRNGGLPQDDQALARIVRADGRAWRHLKATLEPLFQAGWKHKRIDAELARAEDMKNRRRAQTERARVIGSGKSTTYKFAGEQNDLSPPILSDKPLKTNNLASCNRTQADPVTGVQSQSHIQSKKIDDPPTPSSAREGPHHPAVEAQAVIRAFDDARCEVFGEAVRRPWPAPLDREDAADWLRRGLTPEMVKAACLAACTRLRDKGYRPPDTLRFLARDVVASLANGPRKKFRRSDWIARLDLIAKAQAEGRPEPSSPNWPPMSECPKDLLADGVKSSSGLAVAGKTGSGPPHHPKTKVACHGQA